MERICIIGGSGTGKTTLAENLGVQLSLPVYHIDGTYRATLQYRLDRSDFIIYLDYSNIAQVKGVLGRFIKNHGKEKKEISGCKEQIKMIMEFIQFCLCHQYS